MARRSDRFPLMLTFSLVASVLVMVPPAVQAQQSSGAERNKALVRAFYEDVFTRHDARAAVNYQREDYIQHNPMVPSGRQAFIDFFDGYFTKNPELRVTIKRMVAEGDLVVVHNHWQEKSTHGSYAIMDIFRIENGQLAEHWDVIEPMLEKAGNDNGMF